MRVLQISCGYVFSKIYYNLFNAMNSSGVEQIVYGPIRKDEKMYIERYISDKFDLVCPCILKKWHRITYHYKQHVLFKDLLSRIEVKKYDIVHAHTLLTDGGLAYKLKKKYGIPYVVAVRNTDINSFLDGMPHTWNDARKILLNSERIFFISQGLKEKFEQHKAVRKIIPLISNKIMVVPNGIDDVFLENICYNRSDNHRIIYVGEFSYNKNVVRLIEAVQQVRKEKGLGDTSITLIGGTRDKDGSVNRMIETNDFVTFLGPIYDTNRLMELYREHTMFAMASIHETFGLVYIEALSQGLPVLYTKGQGIDGSLDVFAGIGVNPLSVEDIAKAIRSIISNQEYYSNKTVPFDNYRWSNIGNLYFNEYQRILEA